MFFKVVILNALLFSFSFELEGVDEIIWAIRHSTISATYFDEAAAKFFEPKLSAGRRNEKDEKPDAKYERYTVYSRTVGAIVSDECQIRGTNNMFSSIKKSGNFKNSKGCALGPHWLAKLKQTNFFTNINQVTRKKFFIIYFIFI